MFVSDSFQRAQVLKMLKSDRSSVTPCNVNTANGKAHMDIVQSATFHTLDTSINWGTEAQWVDENTKIIGPRGALWVCRNGSMMKSRRCINLDCTAGLQFDPWRRISIEHSETQCLLKKKIKLSLIHKSNFNTWCTMTNFVGFWAIRMAQMIFENWEHLWTKPIQNFFLFIYKNLLHTTALIQSAVWNKFSYHQPLRKKKKKISGISDVDLWETQRLKALC